jgi:Arc/MetJ family transcription regulator
MRTTLDIDDELLTAATNVLMEQRVREKSLAQVTKTQAVEEGLRALLRERAARELAGMYGGDAGAVKRRAKT